MLASDGVRDAWDAVMPTPLRLSFRDMESTPALEEFIHEWVAKLEHVYDRIERCDVVVERPHQHHHQGQRISVRVTLAVPGPDIVISHDHDLDGSHENAYVAIRDAFHAARRQLEDHARLQRQDVKTHVEPAHARVTYVDAEGRGATSTAMLVRSTFTATACSAARRLPSETRCGSPKSQAPRGRRRRR